MTGTTSIWTRQINTSDEILVGHNTIIQKFRSSRLVLERVFLWTMLALSIDGFVRILALASVLIKHSSINTSAQLSGGFGLAELLVSIHGIHFYRQGMMERLQRDILLGLSLGLTCFLMFVLFTNGQNLAAKITKINWECSRIKMEGQNRKQLSLPDIERQCSENLVIVELVGVSLLICRFLLQTILVYIVSRVRLGSPANQHTTRARSSSTDFPQPLQIRSVDPKTIRDRARFHDFSVQHDSHAQIAHAIPNAAVISAVHYSQAPPTYQTALTTSSTLPA